MYIHIYTTTTSDKVLQIWWYEVQEESVKLFQDFERIFQKCKEFGYIIAYTGDVLEITDIKTFEEQLILMNILIPAETSFIKLQDETQLILNYRTTTLIEQFNELYCICFEEYDVLYTFSSDTPNIIDKNDENDENEIKEIKEINEIKEIKELIRIPIMYTNIFTPKIQLDCIAYSTLELNTSNTILNKWFSYFNEKHTSDKLPYTQICSILEKLYRNQTSNTQEKKSNKNTIKKKTTEGKSDSEIWIEEFCNLYAEADEKADTLLSDIYEQYVTASSWTKTETVSMSQFIKYIKGMPQFTIKRKSKGMVVTEYKFLVAYQQEMYRKAKQGHLWERNLLKYINNIDINQIKHSIKSNTTLNIEDNYYIEAIALLNRINCKLSKTIIDQFINNPYIAESLPLYSTYIKEVFENPFSNKCMDIYREIQNKVILFLPFSKKYYERYMLSDSLEQDNYVPSMEGYDLLNLQYKSFLKSQLPVNTDIDNAINKIISKGKNKDTYKIPFNVAESAPMNCHYNSQYESFLKLQQPINIDNKVEKYP